MARDTVTSSGDGTSSAGLHWGVEEGERRLTEVAKRMGGGREALARLLR